MYRDLFAIPEEIAGLPVFGVGLLFFLWVAFSVGLLAWLVRRQGLSADTWGYVPVLILVAAVIVFITPLLAEPGRGLPIRGYGVMMLVGVVAGVALAVRRSRNTPIEPDHIFSLAFWMFVAAIIGARLFHVIEYWKTNYRQMSEGELDVLATLGEIVNVPRGGLVVYGSLIGGLAVLPIFTRLHKLPGLKLCDIIAPSLALGLMFGRIGCLLNGCCFGGHCDLPWAVEFPQTSITVPQNHDPFDEFSPPFRRQAESGFSYGIQIGGPAEAPVLTWVKPDSALAKVGLEKGQRIERIGGTKNPTLAQARRLIWSHLAEGLPLPLATAGGRGVKTLPWSPPPARSLPVHPTQIYSAINAMLICLFLLAYQPFCRRDGQLFATLLSIYPVTRFLLEKIRTDEAAMFGTDLSISQIVSIGLLCAIGVMWWYVLRQPPRPAAAANPR